MCAYEIDTNGRNVRLSVGVIGKSKQQTRLAYTGITDEEQLEEVVVSDQQGMSVLFKELGNPPRRKKRKGECDG